MGFRFPRAAALTCLTLLVLFTMLAPGLAQGQIPTALEAFSVTPLVSNIPGLARFTDNLLVNPWGMAQGRTGLIWIANNGTGTVASYDGNGLLQPPAFVVPAAPGQTGRAAPTGLVRPFTNGFLIREDTTSAPARLIVATEEGTIAAWSPRVDPDLAITQVVQMYSATENAVFKGLASAVDRSGREFLFATDFRGGLVRVYDDSFTQVGTFTDAEVPAGFAPFGIHNLDGLLWVTFALQDADAEDDVPGPGNGLVDVFSPDGRLLARFASDGPLNSPWGIAKPTERFAGLRGTVLIGNFGDGRINVFDILTGDFVGQLAAANGVTPLEIEGLWSINFFQPYTGPFSAPRMGSRNLFFTAGIDDEQDGLYGVVRRIPTFASVR